MQTGANFGPRKGLHATGAELRHSSLDFDRPRLLDAFVGRFVNTLEKFPDGATHEEDSNGCP